MNLQSQNKIEKSSNIGQEKKSLTPIFDYYYQSGISWRDAGH